MNTLAYLRVSTERQAGEDRTSLKDQRGAIAELAKRLGRTIGREFKDAGVSGSKDRDRPGFMELVTYCQAHPRTDGVVLVLNDSRFGRFDKPDRAAYWRTVLDDCGWTVRYAENDDTTDKTARHVLRAIGDAGATAYRDGLIANIRRGVRGTAQLGFWRTRTPFGYDRQVAATGEVLLDGKRKGIGERVRLVANKERARLVRAMFERYARGSDSLHSLCAWLTSLSGDRCWQYPAQVRYMLGNRTYLGEIGTGGVVTPDAHEALVTPALFARCQLRLRENREHTRRPAAGYALSNLLTCAICGGDFIGGGWRGGGKERQPYYVDSGPRHDPAKCPGKIAYLNKRRIEATVIQIIGAEYTSPARLHALERRLRAALADQHGTSARAQKQMATRLTSLNTERDRLVSAIGRGTVHESEAGARLAAIRDDIAQISAQRALVAPTVSEKELDRALTLARDFGRVAALSEGPALRELLRPWVGLLTYDKHTRELTVGIRSVPASVVGFVPPNHTTAPLILRTVRLRGRAA